MDIENMTPDQLREYAKAKEDSRADLMERYIDFKAPKPVKPGYIRDIEFEGETYGVDMRRFSSRRFVRLVAKLQDAKKADEDAPVSLMLEMFDMLFAGEVDDRVCDVVQAKKGFDDFEEIMRIESALFDEVNAKN